LCEDSPRFARGFAQPGPDQLPDATPATPTDPDLTQVIDGWPGLPEHIKAAILALVATAR
jgi:hypothetical protein